jgi:hypothetical protein
MMVVATSWVNSPKPVNAAAYRQCIVEMCAKEKAKVVVEVGVWSGGLSKLLANIPTVERLVLVDPWKGPHMLKSQEEMDELAREVEEWTATCPHVEILRMPSAKGAQTFEDGSVDFWHTDGDHATPMVVTDILSWWPKVKLGGILSGDNYEQAKVSQGVQLMVPPSQLEVAAKGRVWWVRKYH